MIIDLKTVNGVLYKLVSRTPHKSVWEKVTEQDTVQRAVRDYFADADVDIRCYGGALGGGKSIVRDAWKQAYANVTRDEQAASLWSQLEYWKSIAATRKQRNNELADMMRTARAERDELRRSLATVTKQRDDARQFSSARGTRAAQLSVRVHALSIALKEMVQLAKCYIPAGHKNSIVEDAIKVLADTK